MTIVHRRKEGRAVTSDREREISPKVWISCDLLEVVGTTPDHILDEALSSGDELALRQLLDGKEPVWKLDANSKPTLASLRRVQEILSLEIRYKCIR
eukprot:COSAG01_NODE_902_length_12849_cov_26.940706_10_plen_97_part_00